jgi:C-5 cytosine-specific DNA methylase
MPARLLDLFCGAGGAAMGWAMAGFDVVGVDIKRQPNYPFKFLQADAIELLRYMGQGGTIDEIDPDVIHASPPCQRYANVTQWRGNPDDHPDLLELTVEALTVRGIPWVVENVPEAIPDPDLMLCGSMFNLAVRRHRHFLSSVPLAPPPLSGCRHGDMFPFMHKYERSYADAMECAWMTSREAREAIPPAYTRWIAGQMLEALGLDSTPARRWTRCRKCGKGFPSARSDARYCSVNCRKNASRQKKKLVTLRASKCDQSGAA